MTAKLRVADRALSTRKRWYFGWLEEHGFDSSDKESYLEQLDMAELPEVVKQWDNEYRGIVPEQPDYDSKGFLQSQQARADMALLKACDSGNAQALKILNQRTGQLVEDSKLEISFDGSFYTKVALEALERDRREHQGVDEVPQQPGILRENLRLPSGQGET